MPTRAPWWRWTMGMVCLGTPMLGETTEAQGRVAYILTTTDVLHTIDVANPGTAVASMPVTGVAAGETLVGIDVRASNGMLYALGVNAAADTMTLYRLSTQTGFAGAVGNGGFTGAGDLPDPSVARYGVDFHAPQDRLRVTTTRGGAGPAAPGLNFTINPNTGALAQAHPPINPAPISVDEVAYTNSTYYAVVNHNATLYTISSAQDALYIQHPPESGTQTSSIALSQPLTAVLGFDLDTLARATAAGTPVTPASSAGFAVVTTATGTGLTRINLLTGEVGPIASIAGGITNIRGLAVHDVGAPGTFPATALIDGASKLQRFNGGSGGTQSTFPSIYNFEGGVLVALDYRPRTGQLYALAYASMANTVRLCLVDDGGFSVNTIPIGAPIALTLAGATSFAFDVDPVTDRIRVVSDVGENFLIHPDTGAVAVDTPINPAGSVITGAAYTNNVGQALMAGTTTLYTLDATNNRLAIQSPPSTGTQTTLLPVTLAGNPLDFGAVTSFDIPSYVRTTVANAPATGTGYAALRVGLETHLYAIELSTGAATDLGRLGAGTTVQGLALGDGPPAILSTTTLTASPGAHIGFGEQVLLTATVAPAGVGGSVTFFVDGTPIGTAAVEGGQALLTTSSLAIGDYRITATFSGSNALSASTASPLALVVGHFRQHFAEGATGFFQTTIGMVNASADKTANVTVKLFPEGATAITQVFSLAPLTRRSLDVNAILTAVGLAGGVSTLIEADQPIGATRQMTWGSSSGGVWGSSLESGVPDTGTTWYFAEGATGTFSLYYLIENPQSTAADVTFTHLLEGGAAPIVQHATVDPFARRTFYINDLPGAGAAALSTVITSAVPIVAERAMYINTTARQWEGGTASAGTTTLSTTWSLAEGATGFFFTYLLLGNPNAGEASVSVRYQLPDGTTIDRTYEVPGQSRRTIDVRGEAPELASTSVGMTITSTLPIVAERAMWWGLPFYEGSVALGSTATGTVWAIGEGSEAGANQDATFVLVSNGSTTAGTVRFTVVYDDGTSEQKDVTLAASARLTIRIATDFPSSADRTFSVLVESLTDGMPITVEYARYQSAAALLDAGGAALATRVR